MASVEDRWKNRQHGARWKAQGATRWRARWRDSEGRTRTKLFNTRAEALAWGMEQESRRTPNPVSLSSLDAVDEARTIQMLVESRTMTLAQALHVDQERKDRKRAKPRSDRSRINAEGHGLNLMKTLGADTTLAEITRDEVVAAVRDCAPSSQAKRLQLLRNAFQIAGVPDPAVDFSTEEINHDRDFQWEPEEVAALVEQIGIDRYPDGTPRNSQAPSRIAWAYARQALTVWLAVMGTRITEALDLNVVHIQDRGEGKGGKARITSTKTGLKQRTPAVPEFVMTWLRPLMENREPDEPLFRGQRGARMDRRDYAKKLKHAGLAAGLGHVHPHLLRHHAASVMINAGQPITAVAAALGHASPAVTTAVYAHASVPAYERALETSAQVAEQGQSAWEQQKREELYRAWAASPEGQAELQRQAEQEAQEREELGKQPF